MNKPLPATISTSQLATMLGVTTVRVLQLEKAGVVQRIGRNQYPIGSVAAAIKHIRQRGNPAGRRAKALTVKLEHQAALAALNNRAREGDLVEIAAVAPRIDGAFQAMKSKLLGIPIRLVPRMIGQDERAVCGLLEAAIEEALDEVRQLQRDLINRR